MSSRVHPFLAGLHAPAEVSEAHREPVTRCYQAAPAVIDDLVEALYRLLTESPESICFPGTHE